MFKKDESGHHHIFPHDGSKEKEAQRIEELKKRLEEDSDAENNPDFEAYEAHIDDVDGLQADRHTILSMLGLRADDGVAIRHYQGWLAKDVLLQGKIHITDKYLLFSAPLPPATLEVLKESPLSKKSSKGLSTIGRSSYQRRWFILHMGSLAWFSSANEIYFPLGIIILRTIIAIEFDRKNGKKFILRADNGKAYTFKADSQSAAANWVKAIQKEVFRARNQGDNAAFVRIPLENIIKVDVQSALNATWKLKLQVVVKSQPDQHVEVGEYMFAFFGKPTTVNAVKERLAHNTGDFRNHAGVQFKAHHHHAEEVNYHKSKFGTVSEDILDTTPPTEFHTLNDHDEVIRGPGLLSDGVLTPTVSTSASITPSVTSPKTSGASTPTSRKSSKLNILPSLNHHLSKLKLDEVLPGSSRLKRTSSSEQISDADMGASTPDISDNEDNADSDYEDEGEDGDKGFFDDRLLPFATSKTTSKLCITDKFAEHTASFEQKVVTDAREIDVLNQKFREHFGLEPGVTLAAEYIATLHKPGNTTSWQGKLFVSNLFLCFRRRGIFGGADWRVIIPLHDIIQVTSSKEDSSAVDFEVSETAYGPFRVTFGETAGRDDFVQLLNGLIENLAISDPDEKRNRQLKAQHSDTDVETRFLEYSLRSARLATYEPDMTAALHQRIPPLMFDPTSNEYSEAFLKRPLKSLKFVSMMIGSRGDVQPYIGLCQGLMAEGHTCCIVTHTEFKDWVESYGIEFRELAGDPSKLMEIMIDHGSFSYSFLKDALTNFRQWIDDLMTSSWSAIKDSGADVLIESPSSMIGIHIAEALNIPYFRAFTMPWTRTRSYPQALIQPDQKMGNGYNYFTYVMFERLVWLGISKQCNSWRKKDLKLPPTSLDSQRQQDVPFLYCVSPTVLVPPLDQPNWVHTTGYWNVHETTATHKEPDIDPKLIAFIKEAKEEVKKPLVYIGFGSIIVSDPEAMTQSVVEATKEADVYCVLARGWSSREAKKDDTKKKEPIKARHIFEVDSISHQWLFPQVDACVHHGGSGTTGASLSHGKPTIIKPFFGDQFFYGRRVEELGVGVNLKKLTKTGLAKALKKCVTDGPMIRQAKVLGEQIGHEHGVEEAVLVIYRELEYAKQVTEKRRKATADAAERTIFDPISLLSPSDNKSLHSSIIMKPKNVMESVLPTFGKRKEQESSRDNVDDDGEVDVSA